MTWLRNPKYPFRYALVGVILALLGFGGLNEVSANEELRLISSSVISEFPKGIRFTVEIAGPQEIKQVTLRFRASGERVERYDNFPLKPASIISSELLIRTDTADRYIPPGTELEYHFEIQDSSGRELVTDSQWFIFLDPRFEWSTIQGPQVSIHYYGSAEKQAGEILEAATITITDAGSLMGVVANDNLNLTLYNSWREMRSALPPRSQVQENSLVTEGVFFQSAGVILILGSISRVAGVTSHEVIHFLMHQKVGSKIRIVPAWLNEGLAEYGSNSPNPSFDLALKTAVRTNSLIPLTSLNIPPGPPQDVILMYGEGKSVVAYLVESFGPQPFRALLQSIKEGNSIDSALESAYGFHRAGLENLWRSHIGAPLLPTDKPVRTLPTLTPYPTIVPFGVEIAAPISTKQSTPTKPQREASSGCGRSSTTSAAFPFVFVGAVASLLSRRCKWNDEHSSLP
jgi:hypothetical protein